MEPARDTAQRSGATWALAYADVSGRMRHDRITVPFLLDGPINAKAFLIYVARVLAATLNPGDVVIVDNLGSHKSKAARNAIRSVGAHRIFLPAYSPDLNPIEQVFAKLKALLRKARARTFDGISDRLRDLLGAFSPTECANYLINSGYASV